MADRRPKTLRDMALSLILLAVVALVLVGMYGGVSFSPGGPTGGQAPTADVTGGLQRAAPLVGFPVVIPAGLPADWSPSSFSFTERPGTADQPPAVRAGWLTEEGRFISVVQSTGAPQDVVIAELGAAAPTTGSSQVGAAEWSVTTGRRAEAAWLRSQGDVTYVITGTAPEEAFRVLAEAVASGTTVPG